MAVINFKTVLLEISSWKIIRLPESASRDLPSRGLVYVKGKINDFPFDAVLEPDGRGSHWLKADETLCRAAGLSSGSSADLSIEASGDWPEPPVPEDFKIHLKKSMADRIWNDITPLARWDWIRWIRSTRNPETRKRRIEAACSKLLNGERRPCCFNRNLCTEPEISRNGFLIEK